MTPSDAAGLVRYIGAHFPQQPVSEHGHLALLELLGPYSFDDAKRAVLNIAERGEHWCAPSDVKAEVKRIRAKRIAEAGDLTPPPGLTDTEERRWLRATRRAIGDGQPKPDEQRVLVARPDNLRELIAAADHPMP